MTLFHAAGILIALMALLSYLNYRFLKFPAALGALLMGVLLSLAIAAGGRLDPRITEMADTFLRRVDFGDVLMPWLLSFLLFANALKIDSAELAGEKLTITTIGIVGVLLSTLIIGTAMHWVLSRLNLEIDYVWCLLFGALASPTDPASMLSGLRSAGTSRKLCHTLAGESLGNNAVAIIVFAVVAQIVLAHQSSISPLAIFFLKQTVGGVILGLVLGWGARWLLRTVDNYQVEILLTLAFVAGGFTLASVLHTSGPCVAAVAGLVLGSHHRRWALTEQARQYLEPFWELLQEILNLLLFVLVGVEVLLLTPTARHVEAGLLAIPILLCARFVGVAFPTTVARLWHRLPRRAVTLMTWNAVRAGVSVALVLSLPLSREREILLAMTYFIVVFSILVQGLTARTVARRIARSDVSSGKTVSPVANRASNEPSTSRPSPG